MLQVPPLQSFGPGHAFAPEQTMVQLPASHAMPFWHACLFVQPMLQLDPPQLIVPAHELIPVHWTLQLAAAVQSIVSSHELSPHATTQGTLGGHAIGPVHTLALLQSNLHVPPSRHVPPASAHSAAQSGP